MRQWGVCATYERRNTYNFLAWRYEGMRPLLIKSWCWLEDIIKIDLRVIWWEYVDWIHLQLNSGYQLRQIVEIRIKQSFNNHLCFCHWGTDVAGCPGGFYRIHSPSELQIIYGFIWLHVWRRWYFVDTVIILRACKVL